MHKEFADWYRVASVAPPTDVLDLRWAAVDHLAGELTAPELVELARLFAIRPRADYVTPEFLDRAFRHHDTAFPAKGNAQELRVLAGAILRMAFEADTDAAVAAAYALACSAFGPRSSDLPAPEHVEAAERFLVTQAEQVRDISFNASDPVTLPSREAMDSLFPAGHFNVNATPNLRVPLISALSDQSAALHSIHEQAERLAQTVNAQREELDLLWWRQNEFSRDLRSPLSELPFAAGACIVPVELADLTKFLPGPSAILGLIVSAISKTPGDNKASIQAVVNATPREWREKRVAGGDSHSVGALCPVRLAMVKSLETDGDDDWLPVYKKQSDVPADAVVPVRDLAVQVYRERLFFRALDEMRDD